MGPAAAGAGRQRCRPSFTASAAAGPLAPQPAAARSGSGSGNPFATVVLPTALTLMLCNMDRICLSVAILPMSKELGWPPGMQGIIQSAFLYGYMATQLLGGTLADKYGGKRVMAGGIAWFSLASLLLPLAVTEPVAAAGLTVPAVLAARCMVGLGEGVALPTMNNLVANHIPKASKAQALGMAFSGFHSGNLLGLILSPFLLVQFGWRWLFCIFGLLGAPLLALWMATVPDTQPATVVASERGAAAAVGTAVGSDGRQLAAVGEASPAAAGCRGGGSFFAYRGRGVRGWGLSGRAVFRTVPDPEIDGLWKVGGSVTDETLAAIPEAAAAAAATADAAAAAAAGARGRSGSVTFCSSPTQATSAGSASRGTGSGAVSFHQGADHQSVPSVALEAAAAGRAVGVGQLLSHSATWAIIIVNIVNHWGYFIYLNWMPTYFNTVLGVDLRASSLLSFLPWLVMAVGSSAAGLLADSLVARGTPVVAVRKRLQTIAFLVPAAALLVLSQPGLHPGVAVAAMTVALGTTSLGQAGFVANMSDIAPQAAGQMFGLCNTFGSLAGIIGVTAVGFIVEATQSFNPVFLLTAGLYVLGTLVWNAMCVGERVF